MNRLVSLFLWKLRAALSRNHHITSMAVRSEIHRTASIRNHVRAYHVKLGRYSYVARNTLIQNTQIGAFCSISEGCNIGLPSHPLHYASTSPVFLKEKNYLHRNFAGAEYPACPETVIGNDVWIGAHAQVRSGVSIGNGAVIGAGAVVTKDIPAYAVAAGVPARVIRYRFEEPLRTQLEQSRWWTLPDERLKALGRDFSDPAVLASHLNEKD